jgi:hypothetical protein
MNNQKFLGLMFLILLSMISFCLSDTSSCTEQWTEIDLPISNWSSVGDAKIITNSTDGGIAFEFQRIETDTSKGNIGGAVWHNYDFSKKRGLLISFKPIIKYDTSYFGSAKYPQGFAIVFTSSSTDNLIGEKGHGIGYQGIMNAFVFEFDFIRQSSNSDAKKPHFSIHYNITGEVSAASIGYAKGTTNIELPNFYDNSIDGYFKNIIFEIQIIGSRIILRSNRDSNSLLDQKIPEFQQLLEQEDIHVGITSSMNQNKKVTINNFKISEVSTNEKANLSIKGNQFNLKAGEEITLLYSIQSICGDKLKIYSNEYTSSGFVLKVNDKIVKPNSITFDESSNQVQIIIIENIANIYTARVEFEGHSSIPIQFTVTTSDVQRYEYCYYDSNHPYNITTSILIQTKDYFYVPICSYDQFGNQRKLSLSTNDCKIKYPNYLILSDNIEDIKFSHLQKTMVLKIPFNTFGLYEIFNENFEGENIRYCNLLPTAISPEKSEISILYDNYILNQETKNVSLKIKVRDNYGRDIPQIILDEMKCSFADSQINKLPIKTSYKNDFVLLTVDNPKTAGKYTFVPKIKCNNIPLTEFYCGYNDVTKLNNCEFYIPTSITSASIDKIQAYSDYLDTYNIYEPDKNDQTPLIVSLDEKENYKLTEILVTDSIDLIHFEQTQFNDFAAKLNEEALTVKKIGHKFIVLLPSGKPREKYTPTITYSLTFTVMKKNFNIPIQFFFSDQFMCNVDTTKNVFDSQVAFYLPFSKTLEAAGTTLLFNIYEMVGGKLGSGKSLDPTKVSLLIDTKPKTPKIDNNKFFISVTTYDLSAIGEHEVLLKYNSKDIASIKVEVKAKNEPFYLGNEKGEKLTSNIINPVIEKLYKYTLLDKYGNEIKNNQVFKAFAKIKIIGNTNGYLFKPNFDGKIHLFNQYPRASFSFKIGKGASYNVSNVYSPTFSNVDHLNSYGIFDSSITPVLKNNKIAVDLYLRDKFGNIITGDITKNNININVYVEGKNLKEIIILTTATKIVTDKISYTGTVGINGDFVVKIFINDYPVECKGCHFRNSLENTAVEAKSTLYLLGNKRKIPIMNTGTSKNLKVGLINKNNHNFVFQLEQRDEYSNVLQEKKSISLVFGANGASLSGNEITICPYGSNEDERGYYKFCSEDLDKVKQLKDGIYKIYMTSGATSFYFLITNSLYENGTPVVDKSMILLNDNYLYGKTDAPGFFILDLRTNNYKRLKSVDKSKIKISNTELSIEVVDGPESGLVTVFLLAKKPGKYAFTVSYDNKVVIKDTYNYICTCGFSKKLVKKNVGFNNGNYLFFSLTDDNGNLCYNTYNWNELNLNDYGSNLITVKSKLNDIYYKAKSYYNHKTSTFILYLDRHASNEITLSSDLITIDESSKNINLGYQIIDSNHFYANITGNALNIKVLDDNYNPVNNHDVTYNDFDVSLYRIVNDDVVIIKNNFTVKPTLTVDLNDSLLDAKGHYFYVIYFKGNEIFCENCYIYKTANQVDLTKTRVYHKEGKNVYIQGDDNNPKPLFKSNFPFFKINLYTNNNNLAILNTGVIITLRGGSTELATGSKFASNGNIYVYLNDQGRKSFLQLPSMQNLTLTVTYSDKTYSAKYYVMNQYVEMPTTIEHCTNGAVPIILNQKESNSFIKRVDEELELEIELTGCAREQLQIKDKLSIIKASDGKETIVNVIPTNNYGGYLLFLPKTLNVIGSQTYFVVNSNSKSEKFELTEMPSYIVSSVSLIKDSNMKEDETNKIFTYFLVQLKDAFGNIITNVGRNLFSRDIFGLSINNLPYIYTYDETQKAFRFQVPITGNGKMTVKFFTSSLDINVVKSDYFENSLVKLEEKNNAYTFEVNLKDEFYKNVNTTSKLTEIVTFRYITINPVTEEVFIRDIEYSNNTGNRFTVNLDQSFPKYSVYGFFPLIRLRPQICPTCLKKNEFPDYIYSLGDIMYLPHLISKKQYLIKDYDIPFYIYVSHKALGIKTTSFTTKELVSKTLTKLYILTSKDNNTTKTAEFANRKNLNIALIDYSKNTTLSTKGTPSYLERYGYNAFSVNILDNKSFTFFMEIRGDEGALITEIPTLNNYNSLKDVIKRITVINTCYKGVYFIKVTFLKSDNTEFYLKFTESQDKDPSNTMQLQITSAFPNQLVLNNKEKLNDRVISFVLAATNSNAEQVCDERLNIYIDDMNSKKIKTFLSYSKGICSLFVEFYGDAVLKSNIGSFYSEISNNEYNLYNVNPQFSSISVSPNIFTKPEESLKIVFNEKSPSITSYGENEITTSKNLYGYKFYSPTKIKKMKTLSGLYSDNYSYSANEFRFEKGDVYVIIGSILDSNLWPSFAHYEIESEEKPTVNSVNAVFINGNRRDYCEPEFDSSKVVTGVSCELNIPSIIKFSFLDSKEAVIDFDKSSFNHIKVELILDGQNTEKKAFPLILNQINDHTFIAKFYTTDIPIIKQLPVIFSDTNYGYLIKITNGTQIFYSLLSLKNNVYQTTNIKNSQYEYPYNTSSLESFEVYTQQRDSEVYVPSSKLNIQHICLFSKDEKNKFFIVNKHLDPYKIKITINSKDVSAVNSYIGCMAFSSNDAKSISIEYNSKSPKNGLSISSFNDASLSFTLMENNSSKTFNQDDSAIYVEYKTAITYATNEYFKVYINEVQAKKSDISVTKQSDSVKISIPSSYFTTNPRNKKIVVLFDNGVITQKVMDDKEWNVAVTQKSYDASSTSKFYRFKGEDPLTLKVGDIITYYLMILDTNHACYYEKFDALKNMKVSLALKSKTISTNVTYRKDVKGYSQCEYIYLLKFNQTSTDSGNFDLTIEDGQIKETFKVHISSQDIDDSKSKFSGKNTMIAGETIRLNFTGTDANSNSINYFDLFKIFDIKLVNSNGGAAGKENYSYIKRVASDNSRIIIDLTINQKDTFTLVPLKNNKDMKLPNPFKIKVQYGSCSTYGADPQVKTIYNKKEFYVGETIEIGMKCKDTLGNVVTTQNNEIFLANIKQTGTSIVYNYYNKAFKDGEHLISFVPSSKGKYSIDITLNGKKYGNTLNVQILPINSTKYNCMDKRFVYPLDNCNTKEYRDLLRVILGNDYMCDSTTNANLYKCDKNDTTCVAHTNKCQCSNDEWNGFCYHNTSNPIKQVDNNKKLVTCFSKIKASNPNSNPVICQDGSCRMNAEECNTTFECPIGFKVCGTKCILLGQTCSETNTCAKGEVLCWDLTCAMGYDLCPTRITCPKNKVLCPDGSCQEKGHCIQPNKRTCGKNEYQCSDFSCVSSRNDCPKNKVCEVGLSLCDNGKCQESCKNNTDSNTYKYHCSNGDYVDNFQQCPSSMITPKNYVKCPDGGIAINLDSCRFIQKRINIVCPKEKPILCPDYACVTKSSECSAYIPTCPNHKPIQCWDNECKASFDECPTMITCAKETPVLCQNGLCVKTSDECVERVTTKCSKFRCFDGTCVSSMELCPTYSFCGEGNVKCWNGACVAQVEECRSSILDDCPKDFNYRCPDGSCRTSFLECPTITVCPSHLPIKCFDNSCRASIAECPKYQTCGENRTSCPDGTCALNFDECNTMVTCHESKPFLCYDNTCRQQLIDCPEPIKCSKNEVLCPNGACVSSRQNCKLFEPCETSSPIRCENNICTNDYRDCDKKSNKCPSGYIQCTNGDCKTSEYLCDEFECPKNKPYFCKEGVCVHDKSLCDDQQNGCPYNAKYKCPDGTCVKDKIECNDDKHQFECKEGQRKCDDGSCIKENLECPLVNGCYKDRPFKCADGTCINPETSNCSLVFCPFENPYKCPNGNCVANSSDCSKDLFENDLNDCGEGYIMCVDGRCVESSDYCRPFFNCENGYDRCKDGTCRIGKENCPQHVKCPDSRPYYNSKNMCTNITDENYVYLNCPNNLHKCPSDGLCLESLDNCQKLPNTEKNACINGGIKCPNGRCMKSLFECSLISNACPDDSSPYLCPNGECIDDLSKCNSTSISGNCDAGKIKCSSGRCINNDIKEVLSKCTNSIGCPLEKPYRCSNGECVQSQRNCDVTTITKDGILLANIACDASKPYICADSSCVSDPLYCKPFVSHIDNNTDSCYNGYYVDASENCTKYEGYCPTSNPISCPSGVCVDDIIKCSPSFIIPSCSEGEFYCSRLNKCLKKKLDCLVYLKVDKKEKSSTRRLLENFIDPLNDDNFINLHNKSMKKLKSFIKEDDEDQKDSEKKEEYIDVDGVICYDGTIATGKEKCSVIPACKIGYFRADNGACVESKDNIITDEDYICIEGQKKCPDGLCHKDCNEVTFNGCEVGKYQCSNGLCVEDKYDCIGHSMCPDLSYPYRCINGECKSSPDECGVIERLGTVKDFSYSFNKFSKIEFSFAYDINGRPIGKIEIPGNGLIFDGNFSQIYIEEISTSVLDKSEFYNHTNELIYNVSNSIYSSEGILTLENSVMSPVFKIYSRNNSIKFKLNGTVNMEHNEYDASGLFYYDYCLGKLKGYDLKNDIIRNEEDKGWECVERQVVSEQTEFQLRDFGVYAIILNPLRQKINYFGTSAAKNFFLENIKIILIVLGVIILIIALVFYIFSRVTRYRQKYHENRAKILLLQQQKQEYENMTTDIFGQTLGDNINGIVYKSNPAYTVTDEIKKSGTSLEEEIEKLQIECRNVNDQNERLQKDIADITDQYKTLSASIENMN